MPFPGENPLDRMFRSAFATGDGEEEDPFFGGGFGRSGGMFRGPGGSGAVHVHQGEDQIQVEVDLPGVSAKDVEVHVLNPQSPSCVVQWSAERQVRNRQHAENNETLQNQNMKFSNRVRLGTSVDCDQLAANLSRGVLTLTAPLKDREDQPGPRMVPITTNSD